eukprot:scaffold15707_cov94-Skeletonema_dohrnii-CCMP3373.AAC.3
MDLTPARGKFDPSPVMLDAQGGLHHEKVRHHVEDMQDQHLIVQESAVRRGSASSVGPNPLSFSPCLV